MQRVFTVAAALVLFACGTTFAQSPTTRSTALMGLTNPTIRSTAPGGLTNPMPSVGAVGGGLGAMQPNLGSLIPAPGGALGSITTSARSAGAALAQIKEPKPGVPPPIQEQIAPLEVATGPRRAGGNEDFQFSGSQQPRS